MLCEVIKSVILLAFLFAIILEVFLLFIMLEHDLVNEQKQPKKAISIPTPRKIARKRREEKEKAEEIKKMETLLSNIETYNGTDFGQKDLD